MKIAPGTVLDCPSGTFQGAGVKTVVLFFISCMPTEKSVLFVGRWAQYG
ncbi:MAG: hypothetical protein R3E08_12380 [Thiotrichaceae bacterium]